MIHKLNILVPEGTRNWREEVLDESLDVDQAEEDELSFPDISKFYSEENNEPKEKDTKVKPKYSKIVLDALEELDSIRNLAKKIRAEKFGNM